MKMLLTIGGTVIVTVIVLAVAWGAFFSSAGTDNEGAVVRIESPIRGALTEYVGAPGVLEPVKNVSIRARISAQIVKLPFEEGMRVTEGDPDADPPVLPSLLVALDDSALKAELSSSEARYAAQRVQVAVAENEIETRKADIEGVKISLAQAERELNRLLELLKTRDVSQSTVDQAQSQYDESKVQLVTAEGRLKSGELALAIAQHNLQAAEADVLRAREGLSYTTMYSPMDGIVTRVLAEVGEMATGSLYNPGTVIIEVADLTQMLLLAEVDEADIGKVKVGQKARVRIQAWPEEIFEGVVKTTALASVRDNMGANYFPVEVLLENQNMRILSGQNADVDIEILTHENVWKLPSQAVLSREVDTLPVEIRDTSPHVDTKKVFATVVFRVDQGRTVITPVRIGKSDATHTILTEGLEDGDNVVVGPYKALENLKHDQKITDEREKKKEDEKKKGTEGANDPRTQSDPDKKG